MYHWTSPRAPVRGGGSGGRSDRPPPSGLHLRFGGLARAEGLRDNVPREVPEFGAHDLDLGHWQTQARELRGVVGVGVADLPGALREESLHLEGPCGRPGQHLLARHDRNGLVRQFCADRQPHLDLRYTGTARRLAHEVLADFLPHVVVVVGPEAEAHHGVDQPRLQAAQSATAGPPRKQHFSLEEGLGGGAVPTSGLHGVSHTARGDA
mmetsp:Transcript_55287/g.149136  ORF Transcript_55287/g.149136 Transcript_55287/m.149136 type:complete len:209 (-) Transcript_55287:2634-3260(-)